MWVLTTSGFYSAVASADNDTDVVVRARHRGDLAHLNDELKRLGFKPATVLAYAHSDYPWRVVIPKTTWATYLADEAQAIDYRNFKSEVTRTQGQARHDIYSRVWGVLLSLEKLPHAMAGHAKAVKRTPQRASRWSNAPLASWDKDWGHGTLDRRLGAELPEPHMYDDEVGAALAEHDMGLYDPTSPFYIGPGI